MDLSNLRPADGSKHSDNFRRGRGHGSGNGPKRGFKNRNSKEIVGINVSALEVFDNDAVVSVETLIEAGIVKHARDGVKILGNGELTKKLTVQANAFSAGAVEKIEAVGGKAEVI